MKNWNEVGFGLGILVALFTSSLADTADSQTVDSFNPNPNNVVYSAIQTPDGNVLAGGAFTRVGGASIPCLVRLFQDGSVDPTFSPGLTGSEVYCIACQTNGQFLVGGVFYEFCKEVNHNNIARFNADGSLDTNFILTSVSGSPPSVTCLAIQPDNRILMSGAFARVASSNIMGLCRINGDGSLDTNFNAAANGSVYSFALQPDGKILAEGVFTTIGGGAQTNLARLNADGTLDGSFQTPRFTFMNMPEVIGIGGALLVQPDGRILVGGLYDKVNGLAHTNIVRLNADGSVDSTFAAQVDPSDCWGMQTLMLQADGKIIIGDDSFTMNGQPCPYLGRLNTDGSTDAGFSTNLIYGVMVYNAALQADGKILTGGVISKLGGQARNNFGRLINNTPATQTLSNDGTNLTWLRGGSSPEVGRTTFEASTDQTHWLYLGDGVRISGGWQLTNALIATNIPVRARGFVTGGRCNGSSWFVESIYPQTTPWFVTNDGNLGCRTNQFGGCISGSAGSTVVVEGSSDLINWTPITTNLIYAKPGYFTDPASTNAAQKFYRVQRQ